MTRKLTAAEQALVQRYLALEARAAWLAKRLMLPPAAVALACGWWVAEHSAGLALGLWLLGGFVLALPYLIQRQTRFRVENRARRLHGALSSESAPQFGKIYRLGGQRVTLPLGWDSFWTDGATLEVDVCHLLKPKVNEPAVVLLLSLPPVSAEVEAGVSPLAAQGNGWLALNAILLALCLLAGRALFTADSEQTLGTVLHLRAPRHFGSVAELLRQSEVPVGVEVDIDKAYRIGLDAESYLVDLHEDELASFAPLMMPSTNDSEPADAEAADAEAAAQLRFNDELAHLKERVLAKRYDSLAEQGEGRLPGSVALAENIHGIVKQSAWKLTFVTDAKSDAPAVWGRFLAALLAFVVTLLLAWRRHRAVHRALRDWQTRVVAAATPSE